MAWNGSNQSQNAGSGANPKVSRPTKPSGRRPLRWLVLLAVLAALAVVAYFALRGGRGEHKPPPTRGKTTAVAPATNKTSSASGKRAENTALPEVTGEQIAEQAAKKTDA